MEREGCGVSHRRGMYAEIYRKKGSQQARAGG